MRPAYVIGMQLAVAGPALLTALVCGCGQPTGPPSPAATLHTQGSPGVEGNGRLRHSGPVVRKDVVGQWIGVYSSYPDLLGPDVRDPETRARWEASMKGPKYRLLLKVDGTLKLTTLIGLDLDREHEGPDVDKGTWSLKGTKVEIRFAAKPGGALKPPRSHVLEFDSKDGSMTEEVGDGFTVVFRRK